MRALVILSLLFTGYVGAQECNQRPAFLLVGQSNMAGNAPVEEQDQIKDGRVLSLKYSASAPYWLVGKDPLQNGVSIGFNFAKAYADAHPGVLVGLYPMAVGNTDIGAWGVGANNHNKAVAAVSLVGPFQLAGILWHQGESDATATHSGPNFGYRDKLVAVMQAFRSELGDVPIVMGEIAQRNAYTALINGYIHEAAGLLPNSAVVYTGDLTTLADGVHFDAASTRELGRRYFAAYQTLTHIGVPSPEPSPSPTPTPTPEPYCVLAYR